MKTSGLLVCGFTGILAAGCSHQTARPPQLGAPAPAVAVNSEAVPLPATTPFDGNPKLRGVYLEFFALGYRAANAEYASPGCMCAAEGDVERYDAAWNGFFDGKAAGTAATASLRRENSAASSAVPR